jgi:hypothetical protein
LALFLNDYFVADAREFADARNAEHTCGYIRNGAPESIEPV